MCLQTRWAWLVVARRSRCATFAATLRVPGLGPATSGILFGDRWSPRWRSGASRRSINRNIEVLAVREENARLAARGRAQPVRPRPARHPRPLADRDHGQGRAGQRLLDVDPERARAELADLERLSRDALADVRRAVEGYRELTLPGELARARTALAAAEIDAELPNSTDDVPTDLRELFAWTVREGVTNVIRHSGARTLHGRPRRARGRGPRRRPGHATRRTPGNGLTGLRERAAARRRRPSSPSASTRASPSRSCVR